MRSQVAVARTGGGRRRLQTAILTVTALVAVAASVLGLGLLVASDAPFDRAFTDRHGAHLRVDFDGTAVTTSALRATAARPGVTGSAGPFPLTTVALRVDRTAGAAPEPMPPGAGDLGLVTIVGRDDPTSTVDELTLSSGRWAHASGEVVLSVEDAPPGGLGTRLEASSPQGTVTLTVVGLARSVTDTAGGWATPETIGSLTGPDRQPDYQMLFRFADAATAQQLSADRVSVVAPLPDGAVRGSQSYLAVRQQLTANAAAFAPFVIAFGVLAMALSVLVVGIVVSGTVGAGTRRIGILKSIGCTPWQIARGYLAQVLVPTSVGMLLGAGVAVALAQPVLGEIDTAYGSADSGIPAWVIAEVIVAALTLVTVAALLPALRIAGRRTVDVLQVGRRTSAAGRGRRIQRLLAASPLPLSLRLGLGSPIRRPGRSAAMAATVFSGAVCLTFAIGLMMSLTAVQHSRDPLSGAAIQVSPRFDPGPGRLPGGPPDGAPSAPPGASGPPRQADTAVLSDPEAVAAAIRATPGTRALVGLVDAEATITGRAGAATVIGISGDSSFTAHQMVSGRWLTGAGGEVVLSTRALHQSGGRVGDRLTVSVGDRSTTVTVVGEVFDLTHGGMRVYADASVLEDVGVDPAPQTFLVATDPGIEPDGYLDAVNAAVTPLGAEAIVADDGSSSVLVTMNAVAALLAAMLLVVAGIGVLNTALSETRERARDIGVLKSLGMTPRQAMAMVLTSVCGTGLVAGALGIPLGVLLHHAIVPAMGETAGAVLTTGQVAVYSAPVLAGLALGGLVIAGLGALAPAGWAARSRTAAALRSE